MDFDVLGERPPIGSVSFAGMPLAFVVYTDQAHLATRLAADPRRPQQAAWHNVDVAQTAMAQALNYFGREVYVWLRYPDGRPFTRDFTVDFSVGGVVDQEHLHHWLDPRTIRPIETQTFRFTLRSSPHAPGFEIASAEPLPPLPTQGVVIHDITSYSPPGHAYEKHVIRTHEDAIARLDSERDIPADGCFYSPAIAQRVYSAIVTKYGREIAGWLSNSAVSMPFVREMVFENPVGWVIERNELEHARDCQRQPMPSAARGARIILQKSAQFDEGFYLLTAYPLVV